MVMILGNDQKNTIASASIRSEILQRIEGITLFSNVRSSEIQKSLNIKLPLVQIKRSQFRWFGHVSRMPQERLFNKLYLQK